MWTGWRVEARCARTARCEIPFVDATERAFANELKELIWGHPVASPICTLGDDLLHLFCIVDLLDPYSGRREGVEVIVIHADGWGPLQNLGLALSCYKACRGLGNTLLMQFQMPSTLREEYDNIMNDVR